MTRSRDLGNLKSNGDDHSSLYIGSDESKRLHQETCPYNVNPLIPHFYIIVGVYLMIFLIFAPKHRAKIRKISKIKFSTENFHFFKALNIFV